MLCRGFGVPQLCPFAKSLGFSGWHQRCFDRLVTMGSFRKLLLVGVGVLALHGVQACANETELNPQPLPPQGGEGTNGPTPSPPADGKNSSSGDTTGAGGTPPVPAASPDAGAEGGDAADGGDG
jgi:hypothetical protein